MGGRARVAASPKKPRAAWLGVLLLIVVMVVWSTKIDPGATPSPAREASSYIRDHGTDASTVRARVEQAVSAMALAVDSSTASNTRQLVGMAREAYKTIDNFRDDLPSSGEKRALGDAEAEVVNAVTDLRSTMGALAAYAARGYRSPLADFISRYERSRREWNDGVQRIWNIAEQQSIPSIP